VTVDELAAPTARTSKGLAPKVSVCVVTYNHEAYIEACLASVLSQNTDFDFEVVVGDDCSTDGTGAILKRLAREHPHSLRVIRRAANLGPSQNLLATHNAVLGEYVASLDGDDMALPGKLARQAGLLDSEPGLVACGHTMRLIDESGSPTGQLYPARLGATFDIGKVIRCGMPVFASTIMYRARARSLRTCDFELFDWFVLTDMLRSGDAGYIPETLGSYRINRASLTGQMKMAAMRARMIGLYQTRLGELPERRADFFAHAIFEALVCLRMGMPITAAHRRLLRSSWTPRASSELVDTLAWALANGAAMAR
jgi:glycosyltransferase involved in cell wall biosynthesis